MIRSFFFLVVVVLHSPAFAQQPPNIIFIFADDMAVAGAALGGDPQVQIPNIERLIANGVTFDNAYCNASVCGPSRASMIFGLYPSSSGYYGYDTSKNTWKLNPNLLASDNMFEYMMGQGYAVHGSGKLFHSDTPLSSFTNYFDAGPTLQPYAWDGVTMKNSKPKPFPHPEMPDAFSGINDHVVPLSSVPTVGSYTGWINGNGLPFFYENDSVRDLLHDELLVNYFSQLLGELPADEPFMLALGIQKPHTPFVLPKKFFDLYDSVQIPEILPDDLNDVAVNAINNRWNSSGGFNGYRTMLALSEDSENPNADVEYWHKRYVQGYYAGISYVDHLIGQILDSLEASPFADNTYVFFSSDHGYHLGDKTLLRKTTLWDRVARVPFVVSGPGVEANARCANPISLVDLYASFADIAGGEAPAQDLDGHSLLPLMANPIAGIWTGPAVALSAAACDEKIPAGIPAVPAHQHHAVSDGSMRYLLYGSGEEELYDLVSDPNEWFNLARDPQFALQKENLRQHLITVAGLGGDVPPADPDKNLFHGGFEQALNGWITRPAGLTADLISNGEQTEGNTFLRLTSPSVLNRLINKNLILEEGEEYQLSFDARLIAGAPVINLNLVREEFGMPTSTFHSADFELSDEWTTYQTTFTYDLPFLLHSSALEVSFTDNRIIDFDNFRLINLSPPCDDNPALIRVYTPEGSPAVHWSLETLGSSSIVASGEQDFIEQGLFQEQNICVQDGCYRLTLQVMYPAVETTVLPGMLVLNHNGDTLLYAENSGTFYFCMDASASCSPYNFNDFTFFPFNATLDQGTTTVLADGLAVEIGNNAFKYILTGYEVGPNTVLEFYIRFVEANAFYAVGFNSSSSLNPEHIFKVGGTIQEPGINTQYEVPSNQGWQRVYIPVGEHYHSPELDRLFFLAGALGSVPRGLARIAKLRIYEQDECPPSERGAQGSDVNTLTAEAKYPVHIHPNPLQSGQLHYSFLDAHPQEISGVLRIYSQQGKLVHSTVIDMSARQGSADVQHLAAGIYFLEFSAGQWVATHKLVRY